MLSQQTGVAYFFSRAVPPLSPKSSARISFQNAQALKGRSSTNLKKASSCLDVDLCKIAAVREHIPVRRNHCILSWLARAAVQITAMKTAERNKESSGVSFCLHEGGRLPCGFSTFCCIQENRTLLWMFEPWAQPQVAGKRSSAFRCPCFLHTEWVAFVLCLFGTVCSLFCAVVALLLLGWDALCT